MKILKICLTYLMLIIFSTCTEAQFPIYHCSEYLIDQYGITAHIAYKNEKYGDYSCRDSLLVLAKKAGVNYVRFDFDPQYESIWGSAVKSVKEVGLKPYVVLTKKNNNSNLRPWDDFINYQKYLVSTVKESGNQVSVWEVMNEVDLLYDNNDNEIKNNKIATKGYTEILPKIVSYLRNHSSGSSISMGSICNWNYCFINTLFNKKYFDYTDIFNIHLYSEPEKLINGIAHMKKKMDNSNCYPEVWLTECGMSTNIDQTNSITKEELEIEQALRVARIHLLSFAYGVEKVFWYNLRSLENDPYNKESHFGLLHSDLSAKPSYYAYKTLTEMCPSGSLRPKLEIKDGVYMCYWDRPDGKRVWAVWSIKEQPMSKLKMKRVSTFYNYMGSKCNKPLNINNGVLYIVGDFKTKVEFKY